MQYLKFIPITIFIAACFFVSQYAHAQTVITTERVPSGGVIDNSENVVYTVEMSGLTVGRFARAMLNFSTFPDTSVTIASTACIPVVSTTQTFEFVFPLQNYPFDMVVNSATARFSATDCFSSTSLTQVDIEPLFNNANSLFAMYVPEGTASSSVEVTYQNTTFDVILWISILWILIFGIVVWIFRKFTA